MKRSISVVIPNYNGKHLIEKNLPTIIAALEFSKVEYEIIIPDDCSKDDSVKFIKDKFPEVIVVTNTTNLGFSGNINRGLRLAKYDLTFAVNSDVSIEQDYFEHQFIHFKDDNIFGVMGGIYDEQTNKLIDAAKLCEQTISGEINSTKNAYTQDDRVLPTYFPSGANALVDTKKLKKINYFNEIYSPFYKEDTDLGLVAWRMGWRSIFEPKSKCHHKTSSTILSSHKKKYVSTISRRNKFLFHDIHLAGIHRFLYFCALYLGVLTRWIGLDFYFYKSFWGFLKLQNEVKKTKKLHKTLEFRLSTQEALEKINIEFSKENLIYL